MVDEPHIEELFNRGLKLVQQGRGRAALALYDQITDAKPQMFEAWFNKALICEQLLDIDGAINCYYRAADLKPNDGRVSRGLAVMLYNRRQFRKARYWIEKAIQTGDRHPALPEMLRRCPPESSNPLSFISYSRKDSECVDGQILPLLESEGIEYFIDRNRIPQSEEMPELPWQMEVGIAQCDAVVLVWSASASKSKYVSQELCTSLAMIRNLVPVLLDETPLPRCVKGSVTKNIVIPVRMNDGKALTDTIKKRGGLHDKVCSRNMRAATISQTVDGAEFELVSLEGGLLANFAIGKYPVTQAQWISLMGSNPSAHQGDPTRPVESVSWYDVQAFLERLNSSSALSYRLPSEAEWEFACRAGSLGNWCFGDDEARLHEFAWYRDNAGIGTEPSIAAFSIHGSDVSSQGFAETSPHKTNSVFTKRANDWGIFHMHGNVAEWCSDDALYHPWELLFRPREKEKVVCGGAYSNGPRNLRCASRRHFGVNQCGDEVGFRLCRSC